MLDKLQKKFTQVSSDLASELTYNLEQFQYRVKLPTLSAADQAIVDGVRQEGVFITSLENLALPSNQKLLDAAHSIIPSLLNGTPRQGRQYITVTPEQILEYPDLYLWGLEERLLNIAETYLGVPAAFQGVSMRRDMPDGVQAGPRKWHIDFEDRRILKAIVYLNDVSLESGPFEYVPKPLTPPPSALKRSGYLEDEAINRLIPLSEQKACTGSAGTVVFTDTCSVFHRGRVPTGTDRYAMFFSYISKNPKNPKYCKPRLSKDQVLAITKDIPAQQKERIYFDERVYQFVKKY